MASDEGPPDYGMQLAMEFFGAVQGEKTFQHQDTLPSLPVPDLNETLKKYLDSVKPLVTDEEYKETARIVEKFGAGVGQTIQKKIREKAATSRNWMAVWWEQYAYLMTREPTSPLANFLSPAPYHMFLWPPQEGVQCQRAALATWFTLKFWERLRKETIRVDRGFRGTVWCMDQYLRIFNSCKTPGLHLDKLNHYFKTESKGEAIPHIVVACRGRLFRVTVVDEDGHILTAPELELQLQRIRQTCDSAGWGPGVGMLTTEHRVTWYKMRQHLIELHSDNESHLMTIQKAILLLVLDDRAAVGYTEMSHEGFFGEGRNRWYDKALTMIFLKNGLGTSNCEHACQDGVINISHSLWTLLGLQKCGGEWQGTKKVRKLAAPTELVFSLDDVTLKAIDSARISCLAREKNTDILNRFFRPFGKTYIRQHKLHPDAFLQVVLQCAYYRLYKRPAPTYETATTRKFYLGRTETIRSCTMEALDFSKAMVDPHVSAEKKLRLMNRAMKKQIQLNMDCANFEGCDRHLLGMQIAAIEEGMPMPELFTDPSYTKSGGGGNYILSTSFVGYTPVFGGTAPMCKGGYGAFYGIPPDWINFYITCWRSDANTSCQWFYDSIEKTLLEAKALLDAHGPGANL